MTEEEKYITDKFYCEYCKKDTIHLLHKIWEGFSCSLCDNLYITDRLFGEDCKKN